MAKSNGVDFYTKGQVVTEINFPNDDIACRWCHLYLRYEENFKRYSCKLTGEWIIDPIHCIGNRCPIVLEVKEDV